MPIPNTVNDTVGYTPRNIYACEDVLVDIDDGNRLDIYGDVYLNGTRITGSNQIDVKMFGAKGDGVTDDTVALQAWANYITTNHSVGFLPNGNYKITAPIVFPSRTGWSVIGEVRSSTIVTQFTDNVAVFQFGDTLGFGGFHSITFRNVHLTYNTPQPAANTNAIALRLYTMMYYSELSMLWFNNCAWGIKATGESSEFGPWGTTWDDLWFDTMGSGAIDFHAAASGMPNNVWGRMSIRCNGTPTGPIIWYTGESCTFAAIEFLQATNIPLFVLLAGSSITINAMKLEVATYTSQSPIFDFQGNSTVRLGTMHVFGTTAAFSTATFMVLVRVGSPSGSGYFECSNMRLQATSLSGTVVAIDVASGGGARAVIGDIDMTGGWQLQTVNNSTGSNWITVNSWANGLVSDPVGDADKTIAVRDPTVILYTAPFTAPRTLTLFAKNNNNAFNGLSYTIVLNGAINGANTLTIKESTNTMRVQSTDKVAITYTWKRVGGGTWQMTGYQTLP